MLERLTARFRGLLTRRRAEREADEELLFHIEMEAAANAARGMSSAEARRRALVELGGLSQTRQAVREVRAGWTEPLWLDLRIAVRRLLASRSFTLAAVITMGLAIGFCTAMFAVARAVWLRPLPMRPASRLVAIERPYFPGFGVATWASVTDFLDWRDRNRVFDDIAMAANASRHVLGTTTGVRRTNAFVVSANLFNVLGVRPLLGRAFQAGDDQRGHPRVVILAEEFWRNALAADPHVIGSQIKLQSTDSDPQDYEVVGVVPSTFKLEFEAEYAENVGLFVPYTTWPTDRANRLYGGIFNRVYARLKPGVSVMQAQAAMLELCRSLQRQYKDRRPPAVRVVPLHEELLGSSRPAVIMLAMAVCLVLLAGWSNFASLLLARGARQTRELAIRAALGSGRRRLVQQQLVESCLVSLIAGGFGLLVARLGIQLLLRFTPPTLARITETRVDYAAALFALLASLGTGLMIGLVAARRTAPQRLADALKAGGRATMPVGRLRHGLVLGNVAFVLLVLMLAALLTRSIWSMVHINLGFDPEGVLVAEVGSTERDPQPAQTLPLERRLLTEVRALPGVTGATLTTDYPFSRYARALAGIGLEDGREVEALSTMVEADYLHVMGIRLLAGRFLHSPGDDAKAVAVVNRAFAARAFGSRSPVGQRLRTDRDEPWREIVGVVDDVTELAVPIEARQGNTYVFGRTFAGTARASLPGVYLPRGDVVPMTLLVRAQIPPAVLASSIDKVIQGVHPSLALGPTATLDQRFGRAVADTRFYAAAVGVLALVALILAAVGIWGIVSDTVRQRVPEIGVRIALGAPPARVVSLVLKQTLTVALLGLLAGTAAGWATAGTIRRFLFEVAPTDLSTVALVIALLVAVTALSAYLPARRATKLDPTAALRSD